jgi:hypothetical protein
MKPTSEPIGECPCTVDQCAEKLKVFRYAERSTRPSMFKGKFYAKCPTHGRVIDASNASSQEHVLEKGTIWGATIPKAEPAPAPAVPQTAPVLTAKPARPTPPARESTPEPESRPLAPLRGWNLWDWWDRLTG